VLLEAAVDASKPETVVAQFKQRIPLLKRYATDKTSAKVLLGCLEEFVGSLQPKLLPRTAMILQALYEGDVLDEEAIVAWAESEDSWLVNKEVAAKVRAKAAPFVKWLSAADEDEDDEEEEKAKTSAKAGKASKKANA